MNNSNRMLLITSLFVAIYGQQACADSMKSMKLANELGSVLAGEEACGLAFDQGAVAKFIEKNVKDDDMGFPSTLKLMTEGVKFQLQDMSKSEMTAFCAQVRRLAKRNGFTNQ